MENNILGCYASISGGNWDDSEEIKNKADLNGKLFREYIWGDKGLCELLKKLKHSDYGEDLILILFEFYVNPIPYLRDNLRKIGNYRRKEKSIGIPIIIDEDNFFSKSEIERRKYLVDSIFAKLDLLKTTIKRNKLDTKIDNLIVDLTAVLKIYI
jgi:hypothetical protein